MGTLSTLEGIQTLALGGTVVALTAVVTKSPTLTAVVGTEMLPVFWAGWFKTRHSIDEIIEGLREPKPLQPSKCH
jgi:hypothetical protein